MEISGADSAVESGDVGSKAHCRLLYVYMLECLMLQLDLLGFFVGDIAEIETRRRATVQKVGAYSRFCSAITDDQYCKLYILDKLEGLVCVESGLLDRHWCDTPEIFAFLTTVGARAFLACATEGERHAPLVDGAAQEHTEIDLEDGAV